MTIERYGCILELGWYREQVRPFGVSLLFFYNIRIIKRRYIMKEKLEAIKAEALAKIAEISKFL